MDARKEFLEGKKFIMANKFNSALKHFKNAMSAEPSNPEYITWTGWSWYRSRKETAEKRRKKAIELLLQAQELDKKFIQSYIFHGIILREAGDYEEAIKIFQIVLKINSNNADATRELERCKSLQQKKGPQKTAGESGGLLDKIKGLFNREKD